MGFFDSEDEQTDLWDYLVELQLAESKHHSTGH